MFPTTFYPPVFAASKIEGDFNRDGYVVLALLDEDGVERSKAAKTAQAALGDALYAVLRYPLTERNCESMS